MFYKFDDNLLLRGWDKLPYAMVDRRNGRAQFVDGPTMDALQLADGTFAHLPLVPAQVRERAEKLATVGAIIPCEPVTPGTSANRPDQAYRRYPNRYIRQAHWSLTGRCNYRCRHCYMSAPQAKLGELPHEAIMDIVGQLAACGVMSVTLTGGEPLVRHDFMEVVDALLGHGIHIDTIYSNGRLVTDTLLELLESRGVRCEFNMSFDGMQGFHDWLRGVPGAAGEVEAAFKRCREHGFRTGAEMCLWHGNAHTLRESVNTLASWGCSNLKTNPIADTGAWKAGGYGASLDIDELYRVYLDYIPHYYEDGMPLSIMLGGVFTASPCRPHDYAVPLRKPPCDPAKVCVCGHARNVMYISPEGRALPCMALSSMDVQLDYPLIGEVGLLACLTDSAYMSLIDTRVSDYLAHNPRCAACAFAQKCAAGCRASALETSPDDILGPDMAACRLFQGHWDEKVDEVATRCIARFGPQSC